MSNNKISYLKEKHVINIHTTKHMHHTETFCIKECTRQWWSNPSTHLSQLLQCLLNLRTYIEANVVSRQVEKYSTIFTILRKTIRNSLWKPICLPRHCTMCKTRHLQHYHPAQLPHLVCGNLHGQTWHRKFLQSNNRTNDFWEKQLECWTLQTQVIPSCWSLLQHRNLLKLMTKRNEMHG